MPEEKPKIAEPDTMSIARHPIFDDKKRLWGYALHCVGAVSKADFCTAEGDNVAVRLAASAYMGLQQILDRQKKMVIDFSEKNILNDLPYALPPALTVVQVSEEVFGRPSVPPVLGQLKSDGYLIAVSCFSARTECDALYRMADILSVDVCNQTKEALAASLDQARSYTADKLAMRVATPERFTRCLDLGFTLFHGPFFKTPDTIQVRKLSSNEMSRFNLMGAIQQEEADFDQLAETIQADASLSFRLLTYLNSAAFGLRQKIKSIPQAISLLGWRKMKNWLRVVLLNDVNQSPDAPELMVLAAQRGKFLEQIAKDYDYWGFDPESLHLLGIFSLLDAMLGTPMTEITAYLPLDEKLKFALCGDPNNEYQPLLSLAASFEEGRWQDAEEQIQKLNMDPEKVRRAFQQAVEWADQLTILHSGGPDKH